MSCFRNIFKFILHFFTAKHTKGFGVHSPFLYQFTRYVICERHSFYVFQEIEDVRDSLKKNKNKIEIKDFGTGKDRTEQIASIAGKSVKQAKYGQLLFRMIHYLGAKNILELGTSLGITTAYLASSSSDIHCVSLEGSEQIARVARTNIENLQLDNVEIVVGNIDDTLSEVLNTKIHPDFVFIDANHQSAAVLNYFEKCTGQMQENAVVVLDDIYWSADMEMAWEKVKAHPKVTATIDLFQLGIVFLNSNLQKKHYKMRF